MTVGRSVGTEQVMGQDTAVGPTLVQVFTFLPCKLRARLVHVFKN